MSEHPYTDWLGDYVDGTLDESRRRLLEAHFAHCDSCRSAATELGRIRKEAGSLPRLVPPETIWGRIEASLRANQPEKRPVSPWAFSMRWAMAAAAAAVIGSIGLFLWWRSSFTGPTAEDTTELARQVASELEAAEKHYQNAIAGLEQIIEKEKEDPSLAPELAAVLTDNLSLIEKAIGESRAAALDEPTSRVARESLFQALRSKLTLLQNTVLLINEVRKGGGVGAPDLINKMRESQGTLKPI